MIEFVSAFSSDLSEPLHVLAIACDQASSVTPDELEAAHTIMVRANQCGVRRRITRRWCDE